MSKLDCKGTLVENKIALDPASQLADDGLIFQGHFYFSLVSREQVRLVARELISRGPLKLGLSHGKGTPT